MQWSKEPAGLQFTGSQRIGHDLVTKSQPQGFPGGTVIKNPPANAWDTGDPSSILGSGRSPGEGNANPFQYSCLGNPMDKGSWWTTVHGVAKESDTTYRLNSNNNTSWVKGLMLSLPLEYEPLERAVFL